VNQRKRPGIAPRGVESNRLSSCVDPYGVSTRTIVGLGIPAAPSYATEPRYFVPAAKPLVEIEISPVIPVSAAAGAVTVMLPAAVEREPKHAA